GYRCGILNKINVEITIPNPWNGSLTNLNVNEVYLPGVKGFESEDIGGPVYIQTENNGTTTAQALGHITNLFNDNSTGRKYFYYTPIEKVLSAGIIKLSTFQQANAGNTNVTQANSDNINVTMIKNSDRNNSRNLMNSKITDEKSIYVYAGSIIRVGSPNGARCTTNFPVIKPNGIIGILTAGHCAYANIDFNVYIRVKGKFEEIGDIPNMAVGDEDGNDYAFIELYTWIYGDPKACVLKPDRNGILQLVPITSIYSPNLGEYVCGFGAVNSYVCGEIVEINVAVKFWPERGSGPILVSGLNKIKTEKSKFFNKGDSGGPIITSEALAKAHAVGYIVGGIKEFGVAYYMPIEKSLKAMGGYSLIITDSCTS
ncbi:23969_t:CDS:1, partial [Racocetra persica]